MGASYAACLFFIVVYVDANASVSMGLTLWALNVKTPHIPGIPPVATGGIPSAKAVTPRL